jgi:hypothetical protein
MVKCLVKNILWWLALIMFLKPQGTRYLICLPRALRDVTNRNNGSYEAAVGEVNVVDLMKRTTPL